jgi:hypothetical protein
MEQRIAKHASQGSLAKEVDRMNAMLLFLEREIAKVDNSMADERRQSLELNLVCQGFEELVKQSTTSRLPSPLHRG